MAKKTKRFEMDFSQMPQKPSQGFGITGLIIGILSFIFFFIPFFGTVLSILGIIFSTIQIRKASNGLAISGLILSMVGLIASVAFVIFIFGIFLKPDKPSDFVNVEKTVVLVKNSYQYLDSDNKVYKTNAGGSGVIFKVNNETFYVITNRHVVDCVYNYECDQLVSQDVKVLTFDGVLHNTSKIYISPKDLDLAVLKVDSGGKGYSESKISSNFSEFDHVVAIGYPAFAENARQFKSSTGRITGFEELLTNDGFSFKAIESDAYTTFGSSGGGLFDAKGGLIGITTWGDGIGSYAIDVSGFSSFENYNSCDSGYYFTSDGCVEFCDGVLDSNNMCSHACDSFYCLSSAVSVKDSSCSDKSKIMGKDGLCYMPCGSDDSYCDGAFDYCYKNECLSCPQGFILYTDGKCYRY